MSAYAQLVKRGCLCGTDDAVSCKVHPAGDNRGIAAWFKAGMPNGFPVECVCAICGTGALLYPNVELDDPEGDGGFLPTAVCPRCSRPSCEAALVSASRGRGYVLNARRVFLGRGETKPGGANE